MIGENLDRDNLINGPEGDLEPEQPERSEAAEKEMISDILLDLAIDRQALIENIPDFENLSHGQQLLVLDNLKNSILSQIKEEAQIDYQGKFARAKKGNSLRQNTAIRAKNFWLGITKHYQVAKLEKAKANEIVEGGLSQHQAVLEKLVEGAKAYGPEAEITVEGDLQINYLKNIENLSPEEIEQVKYFNAVATDFSQTPDEWRYESANRVEKAKFAKIKYLYEKSQQEILPLLEREKGGETEALLALSQIDGQVRINQFLTAHPEVEKKILQTKDQSLIRKTLSGVILERGIYMGAGFASRAFSTLALGALGTSFAFGGAVAGAGIIGFFRSKQRAEESLQTKDVMARKGQKDESALAQKMSAALLTERGKVDARHEISFGLGDKLQNIMDRIDQEDDAVKKQDLVDRLELRLKYTQEKLDKGLVDFGTEEGRLSGQYNLMRVVYQARIRCLLAQEKSEFRLAVEDRLNRMLVSGEEKLNDKRVKHIRKQAFKGLAISSGFAALGWGLRYFMYGSSNIPEANQTAVPKGPAAEVVSDRTPSVEDVRPAVETDIPDVATGGNNPDVVNSLTESEVLKNNLDLKTTLLEENVTVNVLAKGESIGTYANVNNETPVIFVQPDGSTVTKGAGEVFVHPGDKVIQTADGQIYVIKDSGVEGTDVPADFFKTPVEKDVVNTSESQPLSEGNITVVENDGEEIDLSVSGNQVEDNLVVNQSNANGEELTKIDEGVVDNSEPRSFFSKARDFIFPKKEVPVVEDLSSKVPEIYSDGATVDQDMVLQWENLPAASKEVYLNFEDNALLYHSDSEAAICNFLDQEPAKIYQFPGSTEVVVTLDNGHVLNFDTEDGDIMVSLDNGDYDILDPEKVLSLRESIKTGIEAPIVSDDISSPGSGVEDLSSNNIVGEDFNEENISPLVSRPKLLEGDLTSGSDPEILTPVVRLEKLDVDPAYPADVALKLEQYYQRQVEVLDEIEKQYKIWEEKYASNPKFDRFKENVETYYVTQNDWAKGIVSAAKNYGKFGYTDTQGTSLDANQSIKYFTDNVYDAQKPSVVVDKTMKRIAGFTLLKKD